MVARLRSILSSSSNKYSAIIGLYRAEPNRNVKVNIEHLPLLSLMVDIVESHDLLVEFEEVDLVSHYCFDFLLILSIDHADTSLREVIGHGELRIPVEADVLLVVGNFRVLGELGCLVSRF
jgi:hypothetical protein